MGQDCALAATIQGPCRQNLHDSGLLTLAHYNTIQEEFRWQSSASIQVSLQTWSLIATETHSVGTQRDERAVMKGEAELAPNVPDTVQLPFLHIP